MLVMNTSGRVISVGKTTETGDIKLRKGVGEEIVKLDLSLLLL